jgi:hypothetical protein
MKRLAFFSVKPSITVTNVTLFRSSESKKDDFTQQLSLLIANPAAAGQIFKVTITELEKVYPYMGILLLVLVGNPEHPRILHRAQRDSRRGRVFQEPASHRVIPVHLLAGLWWLPKVWEREWAMVEFRDLGK